MPSSAFASQKPVDLSIQAGSSTRLLSVGKLIDPAWQMVRVRVISESKGVAQWEVIELVKPEVMPSNSTPLKRSGKKSTKATKG